MRLVQDAFESKNALSHQTRFAYYLAKPLGPEDTTVQRPESGIPAGSQSMVDPKGTPEGLQLIPVEFWGNYAD